MGKEAPSEGLPDREGPQRIRYSLYDLCSGMVRKRRRDYSKTNAIEGAARPQSPDEYLLARHTSLKSYPYEDHPDLPDNNLVNTIHWYLSQRLKDEGREDAFEAYDGSALLAIAIEVEEEIKAMLGTNGHLLYAQRKTD